MNFLGVDIGGTKVALSIGNERGEILVDQRIPTNANDPQATLSRAVEVAGELIAKAGLAVKQIDGIGISAPGPMCSIRRMILQAPNLKGWDNFKIGDFFEERFNRPVFMQNDANGAGLAEYSFGSCKGKDLIYLTMSTGIGAGIISNGRLIAGANDLAGEVGHMKLDINGPRCACGRTGCWEVYCGGKSFADQVRADIAIKDIRTSILKEAGGDPSKISMQEVRAAIRSGDEYACQKWDIFIEKMAHAVGILLMAFNPEAIVMGTLAIHGGDLFIPQMKKLLPKYAWQSSINACQVEASVLKNIAELSALAVAIDGYRHSAEG